MAQQKKATLQRGPQQGLDVMLCVQLAIMGIQLLDSDYLCTFNEDAMNTAIFNVHQTILNGDGSALSEKVKDKNKDNLPFMF